MLFVMIKIQKNVEDKIDRGTEKLFLEILNNYTKLKFIKRINDSVYFKYKKQELIYILGKKTLYLFKGDECTHTSSRISKSRTIISLMNTIDENWNDDINNIIIYNNIIYSINLIDQSLIDQKFTDPILNKLTEIENSFSPEGLDLDTILDKISKLGIDNLSTSEKEFLDKYSK
jgi:hypothetical protein